MDIILNCGAFILHLIMPSRSGAVQSRNAWKGLLHLRSILERISSSSVDYGSMSTCPYIETGLESGPPILFMSGFPDSEMSAWGTAIPEELGKKYRCIFMCLPGYEEHCTDQTLQPWGYEQEEILYMILRTVEVLGLTERKFTMVAHDWGAYFALLFTTRHPHILAKLVLCDIGMCTPFSLSLTSIPPIAFYQLFFAVTYFISQTISLQLAEWLFLSIGIKAFFNILSPPSFQRNEIPQFSLTVRKCYPYYYLWCRLLTGRMLPQSFPTCPVLYLYGTHKRCMYHDQRFLDRVDATAGCARYALPAGHWLMVDQADAVLALITQFVDTGGSDATRAFQS